MSEDRVIVDDHRDVAPHGDDVKDREKILESVREGQPLVFITHSLSRTMERQLDFVIAAILKLYDQEHLQSTLYTSLKELVVNATKANAKEAYLKESGVNASDESAYQAAMAKLKGNMDEKWIVRYGELARKMGLEARVRFQHNIDGICIEVFNAPMKAFEEERTRLKLSEGMSYDDLVAFYMANADQTEGEGMGLVMIVLLLKAEDINPHLFRIGIVDGETRSRLEIPLSDKFVSVRGENPAGQSH